MALDDDIAVLSSVPLFGHFAADQLRLIAFGSENMRFAPDRILFREGDNADCAYVISSGNVALSKVQRGQKVHLRQVSRGTTLGENALVVAGRRAVTATAVDNVEVIRVGRGLLQRILGEYPELAVEMHEVIAKDLQRLLRDLTRVGARFSG
jgi:CRP-like cAMP-binding protein